MCTPFFLRVSVSFIASYCYSIFLYLLFIMPIVLLLIFTAPSSPSLQLLALPPALLHRPTRTLYPLSSLLSNSPLYAIRQFMPILHPVTAHVLLSLPTLSPLPSQICYRPDLFCCYPFNLQSPFQNTPPTAAATMCPFPHLKYLPTSTIYPNLFLFNSVVSPFPSLSI